MMYRIGVVLALLGNAGTALGAALNDAPLFTRSAATGRVQDVAHIYYHLASGERVVTLHADADVSGAANGTSVPIWSSMQRTPCIDQGFDTHRAFLFDDNSPTSATSLSTAITVLDYGDVSINTVVDCVRITWVTDHDDVDADGDGVGDGVVGLAGQWTWWDADNGQEINVCTRMPLISFVMQDLPGDLNPSAEVYAGYSADIDLTGAFSSSLTFEICDTDSDSQGASHFNPGIGNQDLDYNDVPDSDLDGDGLADWSLGVRFYQPGTVDLDGDGQLDGDLADSMKPIGVSLAMPAGELFQFGKNVWVWSLDQNLPDSGFGAEDRFVIRDQDGDYVDGFWLGGFSCTDNGNGQHTPAAMFEHQLLGPAVVECCGAADLNCDGVLSFFDVSLFLADFNAGGDFNSDGVTNFFDVSDFLGAFGGPCPL